MVSNLGFEPIDNPVDLLGSGVVGPRQFFEVRPDRFGVRELYRVGARAAVPGSVAIYVAVLDEWGIHSADRDRARRRVARALVELSTDSRVLLLLVPNEEQRGTHAEAELIFPRPAQARGSTGSGMITTVRALIDLRAPNRFHRDLLEELTITPGASLSAISQQWQRAFSVERVTKAFYKEYRRVREALADAVLPANPEHEVIRMLSEDERRAWATRQMGRVLFLWFLQSKRWLGGDGTAEGRADYLVELWQRRGGAKGGFYGGMLVPLFFDGMAKRNPGKQLRQLLEYTPYLNGGLFRRNALEDRIAAGGDVALPDELFDPAGELSVLGLLSRYRFTTRESTPDDQSVDPDPELLGRVFENLYQGDERHDTGTYYTPREIVHFMCRQALDGYLTDNTGIDQESIDWIRRQVFEPDVTDRRLDPEAERRLVEALENVRVCDPAVGSGAFLLGTMQEIVNLRRGIVHAKSDFAELGDDRVAAWKRHAIQWSLYGVDINPEAVEICQLRLWLSLVLDMQSARTAEPLPNLDFRIVAGDSLVDRAAGIPFTESLCREGSINRRWRSGDAYNTRKSKSTSGGANSRRRMRIRSGCAIYGKTFCGRPNALSDITSKRSSKPRAPQPKPRSRGQGHHGTVAERRSALNVRQPQDARANARFKPLLVAYNLTHRIRSLFSGPWPSWRSSNTADSMSSSQIRPTYDKRSWLRKISRSTKKLSVTSSRALQISWSFSMHVHSRSSAMAVGSRSSRATSSLGQTTVAVFGRCCSHGSCSNTS